MSLTSARAKLEDPSLGSLSAEEMAALLKATQPAEQRPSRMTYALVDQILDITDEYPRGKARNVLYDLISDRATLHIDKVWSDEDIANIKVGG